MDYIHQISAAEGHRIRRFGYVAAATVVSFVGLVVFAFVTAESWLLLISVESEKRFIDPYIELAADNLLEPGPAELQDYVEQLGARIAASMDVPADIEPAIRAVKGDTVNAFTTLGGYIFVTEGLIQALSSENSLAMVLAHEIAHARQRDPLLATGRGMLVGLLITSLSGSSGSPVAIGDLGSQLMLNVYSREQEQTADRLALAALQTRYGHVGGASELFEVVGESSDAEEPLAALATHPRLKDRIASLEAMAAEKGWPRRAVEPYPAYVVELLKRP